MQVETYEIEEVVDETTEMTDEALRLIGVLGLKGQESLTTKKEDTTCRIPYRKMNRTEHAVYQVLCPTTFSPEEYSECPIPVRVLQVFEHAKGLDFFTKFKIWAAEGQVKDPVLVAYDSDSYSAEPYILARWGEILDEMPALINKASKRWKDTCVVKLKDIKAGIQSTLARLEEMDSIDPEKISSSYPSFYWSI